MADPAGIPQTGQKLTKGNIANLQKILKAQGVYKRKTHGIWTKDTVEALRKWQTRNGLPSTGEYDTATDQYLADTFRRMRISSQPIKGLDNETKEFIEENYGYLTIYLRDPEIGPIIKKAAKEGWDSSRLEGKLRETKWWQTKSAQERSWQNDIWQDPATVARRRGQQHAAIQDRIRSMGATVTAKRTSQIVENSLKYGWTDEQITDAIAAELRYRSGNVPIGSVSTDMRRIQAVASQYMISLDGETAFDWARKVASGEGTMEDYTAHLSERAANQYTHLADQLRGGMTMYDLFSEHRQVIADTLEMDSDQVDLTDSQWGEVTGIMDGETMRPMTVGETRLLARKQPGFRQTAAARNEGAEMAVALTDYFGRR